MIGLTELTADHLAYWRTAHPDASVVTFHPPSDLDDCGACPGVVTHAPNGTAIVRVAWTPDVTDLAKLRAGGILWLSTWGGLPPHMLEVQAHPDAKRPTWAERTAELKASVGDRYLDGDVIDDGKGGVAIPLEVAVDTSVDLMTDGDHHSYFNRCPACDCSSSGQANSADCACWCHDPTDGWRVWQERVQELVDLVEAEIGTLLEQQVTTLEPSSSTAGAAALRLRRALDAVIDQERDHG